MYTHSNEYNRALDLTTGEIVAVKRLQVGEDGMLDEEIMVI